MIYFGCAESSLLCTLLSSCLEQGQSLVVVHGLLIVVASLGAEHRLSGVQTLVAEAPGLYSTDSIVVAYGLSCSAACEIFPDQGLNPLSPALARGFFAIEQPGKLHFIIFFLNIYFYSFT